MATVLFFEKPGCINNTKQKALLRASGHQVDARNLLAEPWDRARLLDFFGQRPIAQWFNPAAPRIKSGEVRPDRLTADQAIAQMLADPLLIRRPLMQVGERCECGFDRDLVNAWIGLTSDGEAPSETCPRPASQPVCER